LVAQLASALKDIITKGKTMINLAKAIGRVMMTAVSPTRSDKLKSMETYVKTEFQPGDQAYVMYCMSTGRTVDRRNIV